MSLIGSCLFWGIIIGLKVIIFTFFVWGKSKSYKTTLIILTGQSRAACWA